MSLERFHKAQTSNSAGYDTALAEIRRGRKNSHWIWYIFPQIEGLGRSTTARAYALRDLAEACEITRILVARFAEIHRLTPSAPSGPSIRIQMVKGGISSLAASRTEMRSE